ncbi:GntR family transcriptional regulator [bacterium]|nr:GntR family transcriptional regulator [Candidatus Atribacteria bacterium]MBU1035394.1 GntR family transcriptional regulator [bacterium]MBU4047628.1 GntR family transcriptional regulator [bacterium]MBU4562961.1 GntR family transcriptional regulator [bacterium]
MVNKEIYNELKKRIVYLDYKPKQVLNIKELAKEFGVSPMPVREVLILLENEKLVHIIPNNGIYVTDVSFQELKDVFEIRLFLVGLAGKLAAQRVTLEELNKMKELLKKIKQEKERRKLIQLDAEFHDLVNCSTKNQTLADTLKRLRNQIGRLWFFAQDSDLYSSQIPSDFDELIKALEKKDQDRCEEILKNHAIHFIEQIKINLYSE